MLKEEMEDTTRLSSWLQALPPDTEIAWADDGQPAGSRFVFSGWLDIQVPLAESELGWNWIWTIDIDEGFAADGFEQTNFKLEPQGEALLVDRDGVLQFALARYADGRVVELNEVEQEKLRRNSSGESLEGYTAYYRPFVETRLIDQTLARWVAHHTGRSDISFRFEPEIGPSPMLQLAAERMEKLEAGEATSSVVDFDDPASLAEIFDIPLDEAEEWVEGLEEDRAVFCARLDQEQAARRERIEFLLADLSDRLFS